MSAVTPVGKAYKFKTLDNEDVYIGDVADSEFHPKIHLPRWKDECFLKLLFDDSKIAQKNVTLEDGKVKWSTPSLDLHFYPLISNEQAELGGLEFEFILKQKPSTNAFSLFIQTQGLRCYYQPPLNEELNVSEFDSVSATQAIKNGEVIFERPENVVGSYAVYHNTKVNNEYKTGKAFHIFRPKLRDVKGNTAWADLNIDEAKGVLTIMLPQDFLNNAMYPVTMDPTFGYTSIGASSESQPGGYCGACKFQASEAGSVTKVTAHVQQRSGAADSKNGVWSDSSGAADALLAESNEVALPASYEWTDYTISLDVSASTYYWLGLFASGEGLRIHYDTGEANQREHTWGNVYPTLPDPFKNSQNYGPNYQDYRWSIYATYTTGGVTYEINVDAVAQSLSASAEECLFNIEKEAIAGSNSLKASETTFNVSKDVIVKALSDYDFEGLFNVLKDAAVKVLAEVSVVKEGEVKVTRLFLVFGDLAVQIQGD